MVSSAESEVGEALQEAMRINTAQRQKITSELKIWVRSHAVVPDTDERLWGLLRLVPLLVDQIQLRIDAHGLTIIPVGGRLAAVTLLLSRGASWLRGGDWGSVVLACVVSKN